MVTIISGCPGSGKTTLASALADADERGVHLVTDTFFTFVAHRIDPTLPASREQNETIASAAASAAASYGAGGYRVFVDGVIGPWMLSPYRAAAAHEGLELSYVVLRSPLELTLARVAARTQQPVAEATVRKMHGAFADLGELEHHAVDASDDRGVVLQHVEHGLATGAFRLEASSDLGSPHP